MSQREIKVVRKKKLLGAANPIYVVVDGKVCGKLKTSRDSVTCLIDEGEHKLYTYMEYADRTRANSNGFLLLEGKGSFEYIVEVCATKLKLSQI